MAKKYKSKQYIQFKEIIQKKKYDIKIGIGNIINIKIYKFTILLRIIYLII